MKKIGIIGGTGAMGAWFKSFFSSKGYEVLIAGRNTEFTYDDCVKKSEIVIINVPVEHTVEVINLVGPMMKKGQLLVDNTGVKARVVKAMLQSTSPDVEVFSIHTMFGPNAMIAGENIIMVPTEKTGKLAEEFEEIFQKNGANITRMTAEDHDCKVILAQGLEHVISVARTATKTAFAGNAKLSAFSTPNSRISEIVDGRVHSGDPKLYSTMIEENPYAKQVLSTYVELLNKIVAGIERGDPAVFENKMSENKAAMGKDAIAEAVEKSKKMLDMIKD